MSLFHLYIEVEFYKAIVERGTLLILLHTDVYNMFLKEKPFKVFLTLKNEGEWHISKIARSSETTYVYVSKLMDIYEKKGLVTLRIKGKKKIAEYTPKGIEIANLMDELRKKSDSSE